VSLAARLRLAWKPMGSGVSVERLDADETEDMDITDMREGRERRREGVPMSDAESESYPDTSWICLVCASSASVSLPAGLVLFSIAYSS